MSLNPRLGLSPRGAIEPLHARWRAEGGSMFGVRLSSLFTSRWMALLWAVLVILTAIQFVGTSDKNDGGNAASDNAGEAAPGNEQKAAIDTLF